MNAAAHRVEGNAKVPVLYMALEPSDKTWKVVFGDGVRRRRVAVPAGGLVKLPDWRATRGAQLVGRQRIAAGVKA